VHSALNYSGDGYYQYTTGFPNLSKLWTTSTANIITNTKTISNIYGNFYATYGANLKALTDSIANIQALE